MKLKVWGHITRTGCLYLSIEPQRLQMHADVCLFFPIPCFIWRLLKNNTSMAADLIHPFLWKVWDTLCVTLARYIVVQPPDFDLFMHPFITLQKNRLIKCNSLNAQALWDTTTKPLQFKAFKFHMVLKSLQDSRCSLHLQNNLLAPNVIK